MKPLALFLLAGLLIFSACDTGSESAVSIRYFDNPGFFDKEIERLQASNRQVIKVLEADGRTQSGRKDSIDWTKELHLFHALDLNKSAFSGKLLSSESTHNGLLVTELTSSDPNIGIKRFSYASSNDSIRWIEAQKLETSLITESEIRWRYVPDSGYSITGIEKIKGIYKNRYRVSALFEH